MNDNKELLKLQRMADKQKSLNELAAAVYNEYQKNIKLSELMQSEILKGVKSGADLLPLFLKAAKVISLMTSNELFYTEIKKSLKDK